MLQHKTRGMSSPQGKPRVYFCCHPADFDRYFEELSDEILKSQNCAVWYDAAPGQAHDEEAHALDLSQMQLFVIPVTAKLLADGNRAMDVEFRYAAERHIPILPILLDPGLEEPFNQKCGDIHLISKTRQDETGLSYDEKLEKYLSSVLVSDELAAKIRAAFDAYIFLSYRKKDRRYAQELMRLIHKNEFCRDIAIWYDEFLTPGENFNDAIQQALAKSGLFALVVTPNLVNETNYVMTTEYPAAKAAGKPILPVEAVPTDAAALADKYEDIPACVKAGEPAALEGALLKQVRAMAIEENDSSPEHNFFIGLAYLGGIDVEVDYERAVGLVTGAAETGLPEAMEKLVAMYRSGEAVERNYAAAIGWQTRLVEKRRDLYDLAGDEASGNELLAALWELGDFYYEMGKVLEAGQEYTEMERVAQALCQNAKEGQAARYLSISYGRLGDIKNAQGHQDTAREYYLKALDMREARAAEVDTVGAWRDLAIIYSRLGDIERDQGRLKAAKDYYLKEHKVFEELVEQMGTADAQRDLSVVCDRLGDTELSQGHLDAARDYYLKGLALSEAVVAETGTAEARRGLLISFIRLGDIERSQRCPDAARDCYLKSLEIGEGLAAETGTAQARRDLSVCFEKLGIIESTQSRWDTAEEYYLQGFAIRKALAAETGTVEARRDLSLGYEKLGDVENARGHLDAAKEYYLKAHAVSEALAEETGTVEARRDLSITYGRLGKIEGAKGRPEAAMEYHLKGLAIDEALMRETGSVQAYDDYAFTCVYIGRLVTGKQRKKWLKTAVSVWSKLSRQCPSDPAFARRRDSIARELRENG